ncbi:MAG TPA: YkvA family protein [Anaerolineales bacterium]|nr:YkvA family protein [Anaerolineales bacterium]HRQ93275.1 YkvA family protein [Anaerolineales bacterium]
MQYLQKFLPPGGGGRVSDFLNQFRLTWRLLRDGRVNKLYKLIPVASLLYLISPLDFAIPLLDDVAVLWLGNSIFTELCPPDVVEEHRAALEKGGGRRAQIKIDEGDVMDADYKEME